jgi:chemotaxis methyl-accepting protein methylase
LKGVSLAEPSDKPDDPLRDLLAQVSSQTNIDFRNYKSFTIMRRISRRMAVTHNGNLRDYADYLRNHPDEIGELVKAFLIKVTGFFRDPEAFDFLGKMIIPELIDRAKPNGSSLRLWSAGCATGEEAYSLALLLADRLGSEFAEWNIKIFATDLAEDARLRVAEFIRKPFSRIYPKISPSLLRTYRSWLPSFESTPAEGDLWTAGHQPWCPVSTHRSRDLPQSSDLPET